MPFNNPQEMGKPLTIKDEGITVATSVSSIDSVGAGITTSGIGAAATQTVPGGPASDIDITFLIDGGGSVISTGIKADIEVPFACTITRNTMAADQVGSIVVDIWKAPYASFPPLVGNSIVAAAPPTITADSKSQDSTLTGWTTSVAAGDILRFNVNSCSAIKRCLVSLRCTKL